MPGHDARGIFRNEFVFVPLLLPIEKSTRSGGLGLSTVNPFIGNLGAVKAVLLSKGMSSSILEGVCDGC